MWKLVVSVIPLFVIGVSIGFSVPEYTAFKEAATKETNAYSYPLLSTTQQTLLSKPAMTPVANQAIYTQVSDPSIDARFTGMLLHLKWLMKQSNNDGISKELFDKQVNSILDNINDDDDDGGLPSTFVIDDSGNVTTGVWLATVIADAYVSDTLTIGSGSTLANNFITPDHVLATGQTDEYCLTYEATGDTWAWQTCGSGGSGVATTSIDTSAEVASIVTDETGSGALVFAGSPTLTGTVAAANANFSGNVGVGTSSPYADLSVAGDIALTGGLYDSGSSRGSNGMVLLSTGTGVDWVATSTLGISSGGGSLFTDGGATTYLTANGDFLGIGTSTANHRLTVEGNLNLSTAGGAIYFDDARFIYASSTNHSLTFGEYAGETFDATDQYNVALGYYAGRLATSNYNNFIGGFAGYSSDGTHNYLLGYNSGYNNNGSTNFIVGPDSGYNSVGSNNMIFGDDAGYNNNGSENFIAGSFAGYNNAGDNNIFVGYNAARYVQGDTNIALGGEALFGSHATNFLSDNNIAIGYRAGYASDDGSGNNILIGYQAASNLTTGNNNIIIGHSISAVTAAADNRLNIGNLIFGTGLDGTGTTTSSGNVGIGSTTPSSKLTIQSTGSGNSFIVEDQAADTTPFVIDGSGNVGIGVATSANTKFSLSETYTNTSSYRYGINATIYADPTANSSAFHYGSLMSMYSQTGNIYNITGGLIGVAGGAYHQGSGSLTTLLGAAFDSGNWSTGAVTNATTISVGADNSNVAGTISTQKYINVSDLSNAGTITNTYGLYLGDLTAGTQTNAPYAIYSADSGAKSYFAGSLGIGTTTPAQKLQVYGNIRVGTTGFAGCLEDYNGGLIAGTCSSDEGLKENIEPLASSTPRSYLEAIAALTPVTYTWNEEAAGLYSKNMNVANLGLIAQDVEAQFPELVSIDEEGYRQVDFRAFPFYIIQALKELWIKVQGHDERIEELEEENSDLKNRLDEIEDELNIDTPPPPTPTVPEPTPEPDPEPPSEPAPESVI